MSIIRANTLQNTAGSKSVPVDTVVDGSAKAWVNFNGTGTVAIRAAFNVSSITDNGTGDYTVNFTTAMPDANYSVIGLCTIENFSTSTTLSNSGITYPTPISYATSSIRLRHVNPADSGGIGGGPFDVLFGNVAIFR